MSRGTSLLIAGTDTGVGKTILTASIASYYLKYYPDRKLAIYKPVQSGQGDREYYLKNFPLEQSLEQITPIYLENPLAPPIAAEKEGKTIDLGLIWQKYQELVHHYDLVLVESLGGLGSPITKEYLVSDLAKDWHIPTILVSSIKLGCLSQIIAHTALARASNLDCRGIILNSINPEFDLDSFAPIPLIENLVHLPVLGVMPYLPQRDDRLALAEALANLANFPITELLLG
jgi:dethiobiotin synthetase